MAMVVGPPGHPEFGRCALIAGPDTAPRSGADDLSQALPALTHEARAIFTERAARLVDIASSTDATGAAGPSPARVFLSWYGPPEAVWIFGAGHIGRALAPMVARLGYEVTICDDRPEYVTAERFPDPCLRRVGDFRELARECAAIAGRWIVLVTRGHDHDESILRVVRDARPRYLGMIGSGRRVATVRKRLAAAGVTAEFLDAIHAPIGLPIGADSPEEIAVSITAEMIAVRRGSGPKGRSTSLSADTSGFAELWDRMAGVIGSGRPAVLATIVSRRGSAPRGTGAQMAVFADGSTMGTVGGGCGEEEIKTAARRLILSGGPPALIEINLSGDPASETADICGGGYAVFVNLVSQADPSDGSQRSP